MSLMTLLRAFAPSAIAARRRDDELETLREENQRLRAERDALRAELQSDMHAELTTLRNALYRLNHEQAARAQAGMLQQMQAQHNPLAQYNQQQGMLGLQAQNWHAFLEDRCNCVPDRAGFLSDG